MNFIAATTLRNNLSETLNHLKKTGKYMLVSKRGKITSALVDIDLFEDLIALYNQDYLKSIQQARQDYKKGKVHSFQEVFGQV
jgi:hypothetical protein